MRKNDLISSIVFLIVAGVLFFHTGTYPVKESGSIVLNPGFYPQLLGIILAVLSVILFLSSLKRENQNDHKQEIWKTKKSVFLFLLTLGLLVLYPFIMNYFGFATAAFIFLFTLITALTENAKSRILPILGVSLGLTIVMYLVFHVFLRIPFPTGILI
ncbi:MAG: tripartite tricarboxylate transporter TctB family protein [Bacteroidales bacterium]|nr:tripartite tricarboxylate transporter TctB family protein [Bacteroidales bacterium]